MGLANVAYTGLSIWGKMRAVMFFFVFLFVGGIMSFIGIFVLTRKNKKTARTKGRVDGGSCLEDCRSWISFTVDGRGVKTSVQGFFAKGAEIDIWYDPGNPVDASAVEKDPWLIWAAFVLVGFGIVALGAFNVYFTFKYKEVAAISAGMNLVT
jgi:hypothetical protein